MKSEHENMTSVGPLPVGKMSVPELRDLLRYSADREAMCAHSVYAEGFINWIESDILSEDDEDGVE